MSLADLDPDPLLTLTRWHSEARARGAVEPDAMTLATASDGRPAARIVLFKGLSAGKIQFVTNYESRKGREIEANPQVALVFFWVETMKQVRVEGRAERASADESDRYFASRPRESQLGAWASDQSRVAVSREELEERFAATHARFEGKVVERPAHWGIYSVIPDVVELWSSRPHRLHDRLRYQRHGASWSVDRLFP